MASKILATLSQQIERVSHSYLCQNTYRTETETVCDDGTLLHRSDVTCLRGAVYSPYTLLKYKFLYITSLFMKHH